MSQSHYHKSPANNYTIVDSLPEKINKFRTETDQDETFWIGDFSKVKKSLDAWENNLPNIHLHYAIKCCPEPKLAKYIIDKGKGFDCASMNEIKLVLSLGCDPKKILFAHPLKSEKAILYSKEKGVKKMVVDTVEELVKIKELYEDAEIFIRIMPRFSKAVFQLSDKFGAPEEIVNALIDKCKELNLNLIGFSFHVGSLCDDLDTFKEAIKYVAEFKKKAEDKNFKITFIDIGGGFLPFSRKTKYTFEQIAKSIKDAIETYIPDKDVEFCAEPGRYIATDYLDLCMPILCTKQKEVEGKEPSQLIYIPDGIYGAFNCLTYDHAKPHFYIQQKEKNNDIYDTKIFGQTCDCEDVVYEECKWPKLKKGDFMYIENFGAYTYAACAFFNGFDHHRIFYLNE